MNSRSIPLGELIAEIRNGVDVDQNDAPQPDMLPVSRIETISNGVVDLSRVKYARVTNGQIAKYKLRRGDILFSHINSPQHIGKTALFDTDETLIHGINLLLLRPDHIQCDSAYLNYYLKSYSVRARFRARCKKAVNQASLSQSDILELQVPLLPLLDQQLIAALLDRADRLRRTRCYAEELSASFLHSVFIQMFGDPVKNPTGWDKTQIKEVAQIIVPTRDKPKFFRGDVPWVTLPDLDGLFISTARNLLTKEDAAEVGNHLMPTNTVLLSCAGSLGKVVVASREVYANQQFYGFVTKTELLNNLFLAIQLKMLGEAFFLNLAGVSTLAFFSKDKALAIEITVPPLTLQQKFARIVQKHELLRAQQREATRQAEHLFQTLLHRAFSGEL